MASSPLFEHDWTFPGAAAVVAIVHGYAEHGGRYEHVARALRPHGIATFAADLRGHGRSPGRRGHVAHFDEYHDDARAVLAAAKRRTPGVPAFLLGHSMGGLVLLDMLAAGIEPDVAGVIVTSPLLGMVRKVSAVTRRFVAVVGRVWPSCPFPSGLDGSIVCRDPDRRRDYDEDPLIFRRTTARWFVEATRAIARVHGADLGQLPPLLLLVAGDDRVVSAAATRRFASEHGLEDRSHELAGYYHEILNEERERREAVIDRIAQWILAGR